jgi:RND superfamily putative drug exporter
MLVPATMALLGEKNWYVPKWLAKILPVVNFSH